MLSSFISNVYIRDIKAVLLMVTFLITLSLYGQNITKNCKTCGKPISQCKYNGFHERRNNTNSRRCEVCKKPISKCEYNGNHYLEQKDNDNSAYISIETTKVVDLGLPSGTLWAGWNLGSFRPEDIGGYYEWGKVYDASYLDDFWIHHSIYDEVTPFMDRIEGTQYDVASSEWGEKWRLPTTTQMYELCEQCKWRWFQYHGVWGYAVTGPNNKSIFLPACHGLSGTIEDTGVEGRYLSSNIIVECSIQTYSIENFTINFLGFKENEIAIMSDFYVSTISTRLRLIRPVCSLNMDKKLSDTNY